MCCLSETVWFIGNRVSVASKPQILKPETWTLIWLRPKGCIGFSTKIEFHAPWRPGPWVFNLQIPPFGKRGARGDFLSAFENPPSPLFQRGRFWWYDFFQRVDSMVRPFSKAGGSMMRLFSKGEFNGVNFFKGGRYAVSLELRALIRYLLLKINSQPICGWPSKEENRWWFVEDAINKARSMPKLKKPQTNQTPL